MHLPGTTRQLVFVETESWDSTVGQLHRFSRSGNRWIAVGEEIPVVLGRKGMGWGLGLQQEVRNGPQKSEGDAKAPAGAFGLGTAFGYAPQSPRGVKLPYRQATTQDFYVDDVNSPEYNRWVTFAQRAAAPWKSAEAMKRPDGLYELGIVVRQNESPIVKGRGSAVFLHVWRAADSATAGCTAMSKENLIDLMEWLNPNDNPLLIQAPREALKEIRLN